MQKFFFPFFSKDLSVSQYLIVLSLSLYIVPIGIKIWIFDFNVFRLAILFLLSVIFMQVCTYKFKILNNLISMDHFFIIFIFSLSISIFWSKYSYETARYIFDLFFVFVVYIVISTYRIEESYNDFINVFYLALYLLGVVIIIITLLTLLKYGSLRDIERDISSPNQLARCALVVISFLHIKLFSNKHFLKKIFTYFVIISLVSIVLLSASRGGIFGFCVLLVLILNNIIKADMLKFALPKIFIKAMFLFLIVSLFSGYFYTTYQRLYIDINNLKKKNAYAIDPARYDMYSEGIKIVKNNWLTGIGYGSYQKEMEYKYILKSEYHKVMHNVLLDISIGAGILSLSIFIFLLFEFFLLWKGLLRYFPKNNSYIYLEICSFFNASFVLLLIGMTQPMLNEIFFFIFFASLSRIFKILKFNYKYNSINTYKKFVSLV
jgi:hypothetical protein